jgi:hypothetical protein
MFDKEEKKLMMQVGTVVVVFLFIIAWFPYFEAKAFNKHLPEGAMKATYTDALFCELRIESK